jgi:mycothiol synthase
MMTINCEEDMSISSRTYTGSADLEAMIQLTAALRSIGQVVYPTAADLYEDLDDTDIQVTTRLWQEKQQKLIGFAYINRYQNLVDVFDERVFNRTIETEMMGWIETATKQRNRNKGETLTLDASCMENDTRRLAMLERHGFVLQPESSILMVRPLIDPIPAPVLPVGFCIRQMGGMEEVEAYVNLHRAAFGTENMTVSYRQSIMNSPSYDPELDLVAVAPDGSLAALCICQIFPDDIPRAGGQKEGWTDPVATHPAYRHLGLAKALILTGMRLLQERGIDTALLGTSSTNEAMQRVAEEIGYRKSPNNTLWYSKTV